MSTWQSITLTDDEWFDGYEVHRHPLESTVLPIMQAVYEQASPQGPVPSAIDSWWFSPTIMYQLNADGSAPTHVLIIINEGQGEPFAIPKTRFTINVNNRIVLDKTMGNRFSASEDVVPLVNKVKQWPGSFSSTGRLARYLTPVAVKHLLLHPFEPTEC
ncbi:hypothetical protein CONPUDRAFT_69801 [Coniophora puteana RWD-64-598 SS2]|uniref:Uncharacterized protein n=1 Tax=Coniophora puteana (strain RWD-64-598) TaxID=741705 RepID=A0A5M3N1Q0_CONPW|nr:uncharacterized protein CONPUDRAFT_69801 [Coniophora puteana RWD-64-598 SS2]EIW84801.1 hypothetical protein CONPUDRAFT_69801 [Coniophora puteana RWD-64-598 SS2]